MASCFLCSCASSPAKELELHKALPKVCTSTTVTVTPAARIENQCGYGLYYKVTYSKEDHEASMYIDKFTDIYTITYDVLVHHLLRTGAIHAGPGPNNTSKELRIHLPTLARLAGHTNKEVANRVCEVIGYRGRCLLSNSNKTELPNWLRFCSTNHSDICFHDAITGIAGAMTFRYPHQAVFHYKFACPLTIAMQQNVAFEDLTDCKKSIVAERVWRAVWIRARVNFVLFTESEETRLFQPYELTPNRMEWVRFLHATKKSSSYGKSHLQSNYLESHV